MAVYNPFYILPGVEGDGFYAYDSTTQELLVGPCDSEKQASELAWEVLKDYYDNTAYLGHPTLS
jgi:hypothetical protein